MKLWGFGIAAALFLIVGSATDRAQERGVSLVLLDAKIVSMDDRTLSPNPGHLYQAAAIDGNKILRLGTNEEIEKFVGSATQVIRLNGRTILPGLIDTHTHPESFALLYRLDTARGVFQPHNTFEVDFRLSIDEIVKQKLEIVEEMVKVIPKGEWIRVMLGGPRFGMAAVDRKIFDSDTALMERIGRDRLNKIAPDHPVIVGTNYAIVNDKAIEVMRQEWPPHLVAKMEEQNWMFRVGVGEAMYHFPYMFGKKAGLERMAEVMRLELNMLPRVGVTTYSTRSPSEVAIALFRYMRNTDQLPIRVGIADEVVRRYPSTDQMQVARSMTPISGKPDDDRFWIAGLAYEEGWKDEPAFSAVAEAIRRGSRPAHLHLHEEDARGWRFIEMLEKAGLTPEQSRALRPLTLHFTDVFDRKLFAELGKWGVYQTAFGVTGLGFSPQKGGHAPGVPVKAALDAGMKLVWESDQINTIGSNTGKPFNALQVYVTRKWETPDNLGGGTIDADQAVDRVVALKMMTTWSSEALFMEDKIGTLEEGKLADLIVLNKDVLTVPPEDIHTVTPLMTIIDGKIAFDTGIARQAAVQSTAAVR